MSANTNTPFPTPYRDVGRRLLHHQDQLARRGLSLREEIETRYLKKWEGDTLFHVLRVRSALVSGMQDCLLRQGLLNLERVQMSLVTDPLAHGVEHLPRIPYRGSAYVATHSMIYAKFMACHNPRLKGVFVDSPNLRLELPAGRQRSKYLLDFSQLDVELRRERGISLGAYLNEPREVEAILREDLGRALAFFEGMARAGFERVKAWAGDSLEALGVRLDLPEGAFPVFHLDDAPVPKDEAEAWFGQQTEAQAFFIVGLMRENYDLIYPYLRRDGSRRALGDFTSRQIYNYDLVVKGRLKDGRETRAFEVMSGALREWLPEAIVARLLDNGVIPEPPRFDARGEIINLEALGGYGPFLHLACRRDTDGRPTFPDTFGAGIGIERLLWALLRGPKVRHIEDVTFFGKNPDSADLFLF
jgi:hypothetical protein